MKLLTEHHWYYEVLLDSDCLKIEKIYKTQIQFFKYAVFHAF